MLKIYFGDKPIFISNTETDQIKPYLENAKVITARSLEPVAINDLIKKIKGQEVIAGVILNDEQKALEALQRQFTTIQAAGGLVYTDTKDLLLIYRRGKWDLPKGKLDEGENLEECAVREVEEETGINELSLKEPICITYHTYKQDGQPILKESHWYLMHTSKDQAFTPQTDEDIEKCEWVNIKNLNSYMENTHPSILDVIEKGKNMLK